jgi:hypothetical protein
MPAISTVLIKCGNCTLHFEAPMPIPDTEVFERYAAKVTAVDCPLCYRQVSASKDNMTYELASSDGASGEGSSG